MRKPLYNSDLRIVLRREGNLNFSYNRLNIFTLHWVKRWR